jgi:hypothetical protein
MTFPFDVVRNFADRLIGQLQEIGQTAAPERVAATQGQESRFTGAYYHKVSSTASAENRGISGTGTLPEIRTDPNRTFVGAGGINDWQTGPLDRPSVYMGGHAKGHELDAGLSWSRRYDESGRATFTDRAEGTDGNDPAHRFSKQGNIWRDGTGQEISDPAVIRSLQPNFAFRAFWRTTNEGETNPWHNADKSDPNQYFYPGQQISMSINTDNTHPNRVQMEISTPGQPAFRQAFHQEGFGEGGRQEFKRVNSIDQFDIHEGERRSVEKTPDKTVRVTQATAVGGGWDSVSILKTRGADQALRATQSTVIHGRDVDPRTFQSDPARSNAAGGEYVDIFPIKRI